MAIERKRKNSWWKILLKTLISLVCIVIIIVGGYVIYLSAQYYRIEDYTAVAVSNNQTAKLLLGETYSIGTYNIGFGAYGQDFSFFMDSGETLDGKKLQGTGSRAKNKDTVLFNTNGAIAQMQSLNLDFLFFQEVDNKAHRSYKVNQYSMIQSGFDGYSSSMTINFHSGYLFYPITNPHGSVNAGLATLSKYNITDATRRSFPIDTSFINKFFDLDRCFVVNRLPIEGSDKELVLINLHMSAYDEGGVIRQQQLEMLNGVLAEEYAKGNYVIAGGDFNHDIANSVGLFETNRVVPGWSKQLFNEDLADGFSFATSTNAPTCRSTDSAYVKGENFTVVLDGFIVSANVEVEIVENIDTDFMYSDHNPVKMSFKLI